MRAARGDQAAAAGARARRGKPPCRVPADSSLCGALGRTSSDRSGATAGPAARPPAPRANAVALPPQAATGAAIVLPGSRDPRAAFGAQPHVGGAEALRRPLGADGRCEWRPRGHVATTANVAAAGKGRDGGATGMAAGRVAKRWQEASSIALAAQNGAQQRAQGPRLARRLSPACPCCAFQRMYWLRNTRAAWRQRACTGLAPDSTAWKQELKALTHLIQRKPSEYPMRRTTLHMNTSIGRMFSCSVTLPLPVV